MAHDLGLGDLGQLGRSRRSARTAVAAFGRSGTSELRADERAAAGAARSKIVWVGAAGGGAS